MKKYMLLVKDENEKVTAMFYDNYFEAEKYKDIGENGMDYYCELYERQDLDPECPMLGKQYVLIE